MNETIQFRRFGTMIDCSRNAVLNVETVKKWIDVTSSIGYNCLMLYTEDTYEVNNNPYFGYLRGKYTKEEIKQIDSYSKEKNMELIPCIQTLAHLQAIFRWQNYDKVRDCSDILLIGEEETYKLIDNMFETISECFTSKTVNIGMDEAMMLGLGRYLVRNGYQNRTDVFLNHLTKVAEIAKKYDLHLIMWGDMFLYLQDKGYSIDDVHNKIPDNVELIYWDYYSSEKKRYRDRLNKYRAIKEGTWFAGGLWTWAGFAPHNKYSIDNTKSAFAVCQEKGVKDVFLTMWGDDGAECSIFSILPSLFCASEFAKGNTNMTSIKAKFKEWCGISFDRFMLLDLPKTPNDIKDVCVNPEKLMLYNDCMLGIYDTVVEKNQFSEYKSCARKLGLLKKDESYGYIFETLQALCDIMALKYDFGVRLRNAYKAKDKAKLAQLIDECSVLTKKIERFYNVFEKQWNIENKPHGFDVQDVRLGGLIMRFKHLKKNLEKYLSGELIKIDELEENLLDAFGNGENYQPNDGSHGWNRGWKDATSVNVYYHDFFAL